MQGESEEGWLRFHPHPSGWGLPAPPPSHPQVKALETHLDIIRKDLDVVEDALPYIEILKENFVNVAGQLLPRDGLDDFIRLVNKREHQ